MLRNWIPIILVAYFLMGIFFVMAVPLDELRHNKTYSSKELSATIPLLMLFWPFILVISVVKRMMKSS